MTSKPNFIVLALLLFFQLSSAQSETDTSKFPNMFICKLTMKIGTAIYVGTGVIIDDHTLLTNAHNVYQKDSIIIEPGHNRRNHAPYGKIKIRCEKGKNVFYSEKFDAGEGDDSYDFAVVKFSDATVIQRLREASNGESLKLEHMGSFSQLNITGYPVFHFFELRGDNGDVQYQNSTSRFTFSHNNTLANYKLNTRGGSSGSPLWVESGGKIYIIGIHKSGKIKNNQGILFDAERINLIREWSNM